jgi:hypothetical protein
MLSSTLLDIWKRIDSEGLHRKWTSKNI